MLGLNQSGELRTTSSSGTSTLDNCYFEFQYQEQQRSR